MKKNKQLLLIIIALIFVFSSCTMQKRVYLSGYNIEWKKGIHKGDKQGLAENKTKDEVKTENQNKKVEPVAKKEQVKTLIATNAEVNSDNLTASVDNSIIPLGTTPSQQKDFKVISTAADDCDNIVLKNGDEIKAKVTEITTDEIKYHKCDNLTGPLYTMKKSDVFMIKYANGTKDIITPNNSTTTTTTPNNSTNSVTPNNSTSSNNTTPATKYEFSNKGDKKVGVFGIVSFIMSLIGLLVECVASIGAGVGVGIIMGLLAIIFGAIGLGKKWKLKGFAIAGLVIGIIVLIIALAALLIIVAG